MKLRIRTWGTLPHFHGGPALLHWLPGSACEMKKALIARFPPIPSPLVIEVGGTTGRRRSAARYSRDYQHSCRPAFQELCR